MLYLDPHPNFDVSYYKSTKQQLKKLHDVCVPDMLSKAYDGAAVPKYGTNPWGPRLRKRCGSGDAYDVIVLGWSYTNHGPPPLPLLQDLPGLTSGGAYPPVAVIINKEYHWLDYKLEWLRTLKPRPVVAFTAHHSVRNFSEVTGVPFVRVPFAVDDFSKSAQAGTDRAGGERAYTHDFGFSGRFAVTDLSHDWRSMVHARLPELEASGTRIFFNGGTKVTLEKYHRQLLATKSWLSTTSAADLVGTRYFDVMTTGTTLLLANGPASLYEGILEDGVHAVLFDSVDDLFAKVRKYASPEHEAERHRIVEAAQRLVRERHTYAHRAATITDAILRKLPTALPSGTTGVGADSRPSR